MDLASTTDTNEALAWLERVSAPSRERYARTDNGIKRTADELIKGAIDLHLHADPSPQLRLTDAFDAAEAASAAGMRAIVLKDHITGMEDAAWITRDHANLAPGFDVFGSLYMNNHVGGWNVYAVDKAILFGARIIGAPSLAAHGERVRAEKGEATHLLERVLKGRAPREPKTVYTLDDRGQVLPEVIECLDRVAEEDDVILGTGHLGTDEVWGLIKAAHSRGLTRFCLTHALMSAPASPAEYRELSQRTGALVEFVAIQIFQLGSEAPTVLRQIGVQNIVLSTDSGLAGLPTQIETLQMVFALLLEEGLDEAEIRTMAHANPSRLLGLNEA